MVNHANASEEDLAAVVLTVHRSIVQTISKWCRYELWAVTAAALLIGFGIVWTCHRWDVASADRTQGSRAIMERQFGACKTMMPAKCDSVSGVVSTTLHEAIDDRRAYLATRSWLLPVALGTAFIAIPILLLVLHWNWARAVRNRPLETAPPR